MTGPQMIDATSEVLERMGALPASRTLVSAWMVHVAVIKHLVDASQEALDPPTKVGTLSSAAATLDELAEEVGRQSTVVLTGLDEARRAIAKLEEEYRAAGYYRPSSRPKLLQGSASAGLNVGSGQHG